MKYKQMAISDFCQTGSGGTPSRKNNAYYGGKHPWVKSGELRENVIYETEEYVTDLALQKTSIKLVPKGAILVAMYGATVGRMALLGVQATTNQAVCHIVPDESIVNRDYLFHCLQHKVPEILERARGGAQPNINQGTIKELEVLLPPLAEQRRIAAVLDKAATLRRQRQQALAKLDTLLQAVFLDMFGDPVTNPKGWEVKKLSELGEIVTGNTPSRKKNEYYGNHIEWIKSDNINTPYHFLTQAVERLSEKGERVGRVVPPNSLLVTCIAGSPNSIGNAAIADRKVAFNQQINALIPNEPENIFFLYTQALVGKRLIQHASTNSMKGMVNKTAFSAIEFIDPPMSKKQHFGLVFSKLLNQKQKHLRGAEQFDNLFFSLQQRAFRSEL